MVLESNINSSITASEKVGKTVSISALIHSFLVPEVKGGGLPKERMTTFSMNSSLVCKEGKMDISSILRTKEMSDEDVIVEDPAREIPQSFDSQANQFQHQQREFLFPVTSKIFKQHKKLKNRQ
jgi:hypothetical protein